MDDSAAAAPASFENALSELEGIVAAMEAGQMPLQDALDAYRRGVALLRQCQDDQPGWWFGDGGDVKGASERIEAKRKELAGIERI